eukprot:805640-Pyramimonas_sp.AAC.1
MDLQSAFSPHRPVYPSLRQREEDVRARTPKKLQFVPAEPAVGPPPAPPDYLGLQQRLGHM